jgi:pyruvate dehydrogenase E1 component alpha subunit/2-oxoisovalerate dehydrogenase E1 component alpha subunit
MKKTLNRRKSDSTTPTKSRSGSPKASETNGSRRNGALSTKAPVRNNPHGIPDYRLELPDLRTIEEWIDGQVRYKVEGDLSAEAPPLRESKYLNKEQSVEIYRYMLLNRKMEQALENLFKQQKVVGGVYLGLGQEGCSCASAYALREGRRTDGRTRRRFPFW